MRNKKEQHYLTNKIIPFLNIFVSVLLSLLLIFILSDKVFTRTANDVIVLGVFMLSVISSFISILTLIVQLTKSTNIKDTIRFTIGNATIITVLGVFMLMNVTLHNSVSALLLKPTTHKTILTDVGYKNHLNNNTNGIK